MVLQGDIFRPMEEAFRSGSLLMSDEARRAGDALTTAWGDWPLNWGLVIASALALAFSIPSLYRIFPHIAKCFSRWRWNLTIEASLQLARTRDAIAFLCIVPFCLTVGRYRLFDPEFFGRLIPEGWRTLAILGVFVAYFLVRTLIYLAAESRAHALSTFQTARRAERNYFVILTFFLLATAGIFYAFRAEESTVRTALFVVLALVYAVFLWRKAQILDSSCNPLTTFLYLCALEFLPTGMLVAAALCL